MIHSTATSTDYAVIGGGVVGLSIAYGLLKIGKTVTILDEGDQAFRASRGNFGLVWVQSKGIKQPAYAKWSILSSQAWRDLADELEEKTGIDLQLKQDGGYDFHFSEESLDTRIGEYTKLKDGIGGDYPFTRLDRDALIKEEPGIGPRVAGAILHHMDGHVNPLKLLHALATVTRDMGAHICVNTSISNVTSRDGGYDFHAEGKIVGSADKAILAAGLGGAILGPQLGFTAPIKPQAGQVLISERIPQLMKRPSGTVRQVDEGGIQIGASSDDVGHDDRENVETISGLARDAISVYPDLEKVKLVRSWSALRVMSPDGLPIYQRSKTHPGITLATCHSGITLAAAHVNYFPQWLENDGAEAEMLTELLAVFSEDRFNV